MDPTRPRPLSSVPFPEYRIDMATAPPEARASMGNTLDGGIHSRQPERAASFTSSWYAGWIFVLFLPLFQQ